MQQVPKVDSVREKNLFHKCILVTTTNIFLLKGKKRKEKVVVKIVDY